MGATEDVQALNRRYYDVFESQDLDAMSDVWERSDRSTCTHPGWSTLRGWGPIAASFVALFQNPVPTQFVLTEVACWVLGDAAWVSLNENLLGEQGGVTVATLNLFAYDYLDRRWRLVAHHGSAVAAAFGAGREAP